MSREPPTFTGDLKVWAREVASFLGVMQDRMRRAEALQLTIRNPSIGESAANPGVLMMSETAQHVIFSYGGAWWPLGLRDIIKTVPGAELTIASGVVTPSVTLHTVDTEADAASDNLDTITTAAADAGMWLVLRTVAAARDVVLTEAGNILIPGGTTLTLGDPEETVVLLSDGTNWTVVATTGTIA